MATRRPLGTAIWGALLAGILVAAPQPAPAVKTLPGAGLAGRPTVALDGRWVTTWASAPQSAPPAYLVRAGDPAVSGFRDVTLRQLVFTSAGGSRLRVALSNTFGSGPLVVGAATVAISAGGARIRAGSLRRLSFSGRRAFTIAPGGSAVSDPVDMGVPSLSVLAVSLFLPMPTGPATEHPDAQQVNFISGPGDFVDAPGGSDFPITSTSWYYLAGVQVAAPERIRGGVVALGDSITDGFRSSLGANARWPNDLARLLLAPNSRLPMAVSDEGLAGNRLVTGSPCFGPSALDRLGQDVLDQPGVRFLVLLEGINDIGFSQGPRGGCSAPNVDVSAARIIAAYRALLAHARKAGVAVLGATLTPFRGSLRWSPAAEAKREAVNRWIRKGRVFAAVADLASALAEPGHPEVLSPQYDSGDHIHPNDRGYRVIAKVVARALLRASAQAAPLIWPRGTPMPSA